MERILAPTTITPLVRPIGQRALVSLNWEKNMGKRELNARNVMQDLKRGITDDELMEKYKLTPKGLKSLFNKLLKAKLISKTEFDWRPTFWDDTVTLSLDNLELDSAVAGRDETQPKIMKKGWKSNVRSED